MKYKDKNGQEKEQAGGGIAFVHDRTERPLTEDENKEHLNEPDVEYKNDKRRFSADILYESKARNYRYV